MAIDLTDMLPQGHKPQFRKTPKVDLREFLEPKPALPSEVFSPPSAVELHMLHTICRCGAETTSPEGAFVEIAVKRLHGVYYKDFGTILQPLASERSAALAKVPHRIRTRITHVILCAGCIDRADLYADVQPESFHEWELSRPKILSDAWKAQQLEANPSGERLRELIMSIDNRERSKDRETIIIHRQPLCDPESNLEE